MMIVKNAQFFDQPDGAMGSYVHTAMLSIWNILEVNIICKALLIWMFEPKYFTRVKI